jgi:hypothetical protein
VIDRYQIPLRSKFFVHRPSYYTHKVKQKLQYLFGIVSHSHGAGTVLVLSLWFTLSLGHCHQTIYRPPRCDRVNGCLLACSGLKLSIHGPTRPHQGSYCYCQHSQLLSGVGECNMFPSNGMHCSPASSSTAAPLAFAVAQWLHLLFIYLIIYCKITVGFMFHSRNSRYFVVGSPRVVTLWQGNR